MITISTGGIGPMDIMTNTKAKGASKEEEKAVDAFASLMNMVSTRQEQTDTVGSQDVDVTEVAPTKDNSKDYEAYSKQKTVNSAKDKLQNTENTPAQEDTKVNDIKESDSNSVSDQDVDKAVALLNDVKAVLKETLGISDEELESLLADMGIDVAQLLTVDNIKNFVLQAMGANNVDMLVNEDLANMVNDVTAKIAELVNGYGFTDIEAAGQFLTDNAEGIDQVLKNFDNNVDIIVDDATEISESDFVEENSSDAKSTKLDYSKHTDNNAETKVGDDGSTSKITVDNTNQDGSSAANEGATKQDIQQIQNNFNQALDNTVNANVDATSFTSNVQQADIIRQIIDQIKVTATKDIQSMEVQLNPENLGKVYINVEAKDGVMQAKIIAETEAAKNAIENNLAVLKENFSNNEIKVEAIEVMVAAYGFFEESQNGGFDNQEQANDTSKSVGTINLANITEEELTEEEELEVEIMKSKGNTVSYTV